MRVFLPAASAIFAESTIQTWVNCGPYIGESKLLDGGRRYRRPPLSFRPISPVRVEKTVMLAGHAPAVRVQYEITNLGPLPLDFIWGTHPALKPTPHMVLRIPAKTGIVGLVSDSGMGTHGQRYAWPILETPAGLTDMSRVQDGHARAFCGHYATDLEAGWYAVEDTETGQGLLLKFPQNLCPSSMDVARIWRLAGLLSCNCRALDKLPD